ncbi:MAG: class I SAM-dependent methyltransferase [Clostridia bacterium]|nr:class I SAM-dependent methyltransferase [Clostridia bacterium]
MKNNYVDVWNSLHKDFAKRNIVKYDDWLDEFSNILANVNTQIIDLGCGVTGNNTIYLLEKGKDVISCDFAQEALDAVNKIKGAKTLLFDMLKTFPFEDNCAEIVIADLSLHYFRNNDTDKIISEIKRVLKSGGYLFFRLNSTNSSEYKKLIENNAEQIEPNLFFANSMEKRFFSKMDINKYFNGWDFVCLREENMARWCPDKIIWKGAVKNNK